jgi:hypothetical protein
MKTLLHITAQVKENYGTPTQPSWKNKNGQTFSLNVNSDAFMYVEKECINAIKTLLAKESNAMVSYEYVSHELIFMGIDKLNDDDFEIELERACDESELVNKQAEENKAMNRYEQGRGI